MKRGANDDIINQKEDPNGAPQPQNSSASTPVPDSSTYEEEWKNALLYFDANPTMIRLKKNNENKHSFMSFSNKIVALANKNKDGILGQGGNGIVKLGQDNTGKYYAVKIERDKPIRKEEIQIMYMLPYYYGMNRRELLTPKMLCGKTTNAKIYILMELQSEKLLVILDKLNYEQKLIAAIGCCEAIKELHLKRIIHADIKPENFMVKMDRDVIENIIPIDFGYSMLLPDGLSFISVPPFPETPGYAAPEVYSGLFSYYSDIYALGKTFQLDFKLPVHLYNKLLSNVPNDRCSLDEAKNDLLNELKNPPRYSDEKNFKSQLNK